MDPVQIIGSYLSPYVRKVLVTLELKGIPYRIDPIVAFMGNEEFSQLSPLRRIPVLIDDKVTLTDSSVICQYLEDRHPEPAIYPADVAARAQARWIEEYADTRLGDVFVWRLFYQVAIGPYVWKEQTDQALYDKTMAQDVPQVLDYLESLVPAGGLLFGALSIADIALGAFFRNAAIAGLKVDAARWPRVAAYVPRVWAQDVFARLKPFEDRMMRVPIAHHRTALAELGAPILDKTYGTATPRRGIMPI